MQETETDIETLIAEAEERGYKRGLNEKLSRELNRPELYADMARLDQPASEPASSADELTSGFLTNIRPGVWD